MKKLSVIMLGGGGVGKTSISLQFVRGEFSDQYIPTIEDDFSKTIKYKDQTIDLNVIDTAGQDEFRGMIHRYLKDVDGFIFVYAINDPTSIQAVLELYRLSVENKDNQKIPCVIAGNKCDLPEDQRQITLTKAKESFSSMGCSIIETSAKSGQGISQLYDTIVEKLMNPAGSGGDDPSCCLVQ